MARTRLLAAGAVLLLAVVIAVAAGPGDPTARAAGAVDLLPDLMADPPVEEQIGPYDDGNGTQNLLLRFDGYVHNAGSGALEVIGNRDDTAAGMTPIQVIHRSDDTSYQEDMPPNTQLIYDDSDGHHHWHLQQIARYSLWNGAKSQQVAPAQKVGFCLEDSEHVDGFGPQAPFYSDQNGRAFCKQYHPETLGLFEGVSAGWRDVYDWWLANQWVVVSDVQPGRYWLREDVDTENIVRESDESNAPAYASTATTIPGYLARAVTASTGYEQPKQVSLAADAYGSPGPRRFTIVDPPTHGTLSQAAGTDFAGPTVTYTPTPGYSGADSFTYTARDSNSAYPVHPAAATVAVSVGPSSSSVVIDGAPSSLETGHGVQLHATAVPDSGVVWSVDGVDGGNAAVGTISADGFYQAPATVPPGGSVTIAARNLSGAQDERTVGITAAAVTPPAPEPPPETGATESAPESTPEPGSGPSESPGSSQGSTPGATPPRSHHTGRGAKRRRRLGPIAAGLTGHVLVVGVTARRAGVLRLRVKVRGHRLGTCRTRLAARQRFACRVFVPPHTRMRGLKVVARLRHHGRLLARRARHGRPLRISHLGG